MGQSYRDLIAWKEGMGFVSDLYRATQGFPRKRALWIDQSVAASGSICAQQHYGRPRTLFSARIPSFSQSRKRFPG
jgi:hypothetical protein